MSFATSSSVRAHLVRALEADLIGPYEEREELDRAPSRTYLTGFLVPREAVLADRAHHPPPALELVWTGREGVGTESRDTSQVLLQMFARAEKRVLVAGFAFYEASNIFAPLHGRALAGVVVEFFIHVDGTGQNAQMSAANFFTYTWPWRDVEPHLYYDTRADEADASSTMHAKCVVVDDREVLITSANFTGRAQRTNVELGVHVVDRAFASRVSGQWQALVAGGYFRRHA